MKYILAQPATFYFSWQLETSIYSLLNNGVKAEDIQIVSGLINGEKEEGFYGLEQKYKGVNFFYYYDNRKDKSYLPSIRPHVLKKHWRAFPDLEKETVLYMEADTILLRKLDEQKLTKSKKWLCANTVEYVGYNYLLEKGEEFLRAFSSIVGLPTEVIKENQKNSGGAQYVLKGLTFEYWEKVEKDATAIYKKAIELNEKLKPNKPEGWTPLQIWTACMWAHLYNAWLFGFETKVDRSLSFVWPDNDKKLLKSRSFFHNAGVFDKGQFLRKQDYRYTLPYGDQIEINQKKAGAYYYALVQEVGKKTILKNP